MEEIVACLLTDIVERKQNDEIRGRGETSWSNRSDLVREMGSNA